MRTIAVMMCLFLVAATLDVAEGKDKEVSYTVIYDGGSIAGLKAGTHLKMYIEDNQIRFTNDNGKMLVVSIAPATVTEISYGQDVHRRVGAAVGLAIVSFGLGALMVLAKSKKHYVGLTWAVGDTKGGFAMQCDKEQYRGILAGLEGLTGKKAVNSEAMTVKN